MTRKLLVLKPKSLQNSYFVCLFPASSCYNSGGGGGGGKVRFKLSRHLQILLFIVGESQKLDRQKYISLKLLFHKLFKNTTFRHLRGIISKT